MNLDYEFPNFSFKFDNIQIYKYILKHKEYISQNYVETEDFFFIP